MKTLNVEGLPEPVVRALQTVVETLRGEHHVEPEDHHAKPTRRELPVLPGTVIGSLSRKEIYKDVGRIGSD